jgi:hypothetical protein
MCICVLAKIFYRQEILNSLESLAVLFIVCYDYNCSIIIIVGFDEANRVNSLRSIEGDADAVAGEVHLLK